MCVIIPYFQRSFHKPIAEDEVKNLKPSLSGSGAKKKGSAQKPSMEKRSISEGTVRSNQVSAVPHQSKRSVSYPVPSPSKGAEEEHDSSDETETRAERSSVRKRPAQVKGELQQLKATEMVPVPSADRDMEVLRLDSRFALSETSSEEELYTSLNDKYLTSTTDEAPRNDQRTSEASADEEEETIQVLPFPMVSKPAVRSSTGSPARVEDEELSVPIGVEGTEEAPTGVQWTEEVPTGVEGTEESPTGVEGTEESPTGVEGTEESPTGVEGTEETFSKKSRAGSSKSKQVQSKKVATKKLATPSPTTFADTSASPKSKSFEATAATHKGWTGKESKLSSTPYMKASKSPVKKAEAVHNSATFHPTKMAASKTEHEHNPLYESVDKKSLTTTEAPRKVKKTRNVK